MDGHPRAPTCDINMDDPEDGSGHHQNGFSSSSSCIVNVERFGNLHIDSNIRPCGDPPDVGIHLHMRRYGQWAFRFLSDNSAEETRTIGPEHYPLWLRVDFKRWTGSKSLYQFKSCLESVKTGDFYCFMDQNVTLPECQQSSSCYSSVSSRTVGFVIIGLILLLLCTTLITAFIVYYRRVQYWKKYLPQLNNNNNLSSCSSGDHESGVFLNESTISTPPLLPNAKVCYRTIDNSELLMNNHDYPESEAADRESLIYPERRYSTHRTYGGRLLKCAQVQTSISHDMNQATAQQNVLQGSKMKLCPSTKSSSKNDPQNQGNAAQESSGKIKFRSPLTTQILIPASYDAESISQIRPMPSPTSSQRSREAVSLTVPLIHHNHVSIFRSIETLEFSEDDMESQNLGAGPSKNRRKRGSEEDNKDDENYLPFASDHSSNQTIQSGGPSTSDPLKSVFFNQSATLPITSPSRNANFFTSSPPVNSGFSVVRTEAIEPKIYFHHSQQQSVNNKFAIVSKSTSNNSTTFKPSSLAIVKPNKIVPTVTTTATTVTTTGSTYRTYSSSKDENDGSRNDDDQSSRVQSPQKKRHRTATVEVEEDIASDSGHSSSGDTHHEKPSHQQNIIVVVPATENGVVENSAKLTPAKGQQQENNSIIEKSNRPSILSNNIMPTPPPIMQSFIPPLVSIDENEL